MNGWNHELPKGSEIMNSPKGMKSGISCPTCGTRHDLHQITGNQSYVTVSEQTIQHMWRRRVKSLCHQIYMWKSYSKGDRVSSCSCVYFIYKSIRTTTVSVKAYNSALKKKSIYVFWSNMWLWKVLYTIIVNYIWIMNKQIQTLLLSDMVKQQTVNVFDNIQSSISWVKDKSWVSDVLTRNFKILEENTQYSLGMAVFTLVCCIYVYTVYVLCLTIYQNAPFC